MDYKKNFKIIMINHFKIIFIYFIIDENNNNNYRILIILKNIFSFLRLVLTFKKVS